MQAKKSSREFKTVKVMNFTELIILCIALPLGWCNICLKGLPPFEDSSSSRRGPELSNLVFTTNYEVQIPTYKFARAGNVAEWRVFLTRVPAIGESLTIYFQVWTNSSTTCISGLYCHMVGEDRIRLSRLISTQIQTNHRQFNVEIQNNILQFSVQSSRIPVRPGDIVGLSVQSSSSNLDILFSSALSVEMLIGPQRFNHPAPLLTAFLANTECTIQTLTPTSPSAATTTSNPTLSTLATSNLTLNHTGTAANTEATEQTTRNKSDTNFTPTHHPTKVTTCMRSKSYRLCIMLSSGAALLLLTAVVIAVVTVVKCWMTKRKLTVSSDANDPAHISTEADRGVTPSSPVYYSQIRGSYLDKYLDDHVASCNVMNSPLYAECRSCEEPEQDSGYRVAIPDTSATLTNHLELKMSMNYAYAVGDDTVTRDKYNMRTNAAYRTP